MDLAATKRRIAEVVRVLDSFGKMRAPGRSRSEYVQQLKKDCATYYGYNSFMIDVFFNLFSPPGATSALLVIVFSFYLCFLDFATRSLRFFEPGCDCAACRTAHKDSLLSLVVTAAVSFACNCRRCAFQ